MAAVWHNLISYLTSSLVFHVIYDLDFTMYDAIWSSVYLVWMASAVMIITKATLGKI
jgi:hypothetical protein